MAAPKMAAIFHLNTITKLVSTFVKLYNQLLYLSHLQPFYLLRIGKRLIPNISVIRTFVVF